MSAAVLLERLEKVRQRAPGQWSACCPAHEDRSPSLSVKELVDGRVLVRCFADCDVESVLSSVGLGFEALFPKSETYGAPLSKRRLIAPAQALEAVRDESVFVSVCACNLAHGEILDEAARDRLLRAAAYIDLILEEVRT
jgi:hypothetical protein